MKRGRTVVACALSGTLLAPSVFAATNPGGKGYDTIAVSNPFRLKPIPAPPALTPQVVEPPREPAAKLILQGITDILGVKMALLEVQPAPPNNAKISHLTLAEGEKSGDIEIVSINEVDGIVHVKNQGIPDKLDFSAAYKSVAAASPSAVIPAAPPPNLLTPNLTPRVTIPTPTPAARSIPIPVTSRPIRTDRNTSGLTPMTPASLPSLTGGGSGSGSTDKTTTEQAPLKPEEQIILMEINRELTKEQVIKGEMPPLPPTPVTPPGMP